MPFLGLIVREWQGRPTLVRDCTCVRRVEHGYLVEFESPRDVMLCTPRPADVGAG
jgi:hypothetical protein